MIREEVSTSARGRRVRVLVVERQTLLAELLAGHFARQSDMRVCATAADSTVAADLASQHRPDVVVASATLADRGVFRLLKQLRAGSPGPRTLVIDECVYVAHLREALRLGAAGYHTWEATPAAIAGAVRQIAAGETSFAAEVEARILATPEGPRLSPVFRYTPLETLSQRELDVLLLIVQGATVKDCAEQLNLSSSTVDNHKTRFMRKLNIHRSIDLVRLAIRERLIPS